MISFSLIERDLLDSKAQKLKLLEHFLTFTVDVRVTLSTEQPTCRSSVVDHETRGSATAADVDPFLGEAGGREGVVRFRGRRDEAHRPDPAGILPGAEPHVRPRYYVHVALSTASRASRLSHQHVGRREEEEEPDVHRSRDGSAEARVLVQAQHTPEPCGMYKSPSVVIALICPS